MRTYFKRLSPLSQFRSHRELFERAFALHLKHSTPRTGAPLTSSFWYAVTAMNWVSGKQWVVIIRWGPPTLTMWIRGSYLCKEFSMI